MRAFHIFHWEFEGINTETQMKMNEWFHESENMCIEAVIKTYSEGDTSFPMFSL